MLLDNIDKLIQEMTVHDAYDHLKYVGSEIGQKISDKYHSIKTALDNTDINRETHSDNQEELKNIIKNLPNSKFRFSNLAQDDGLHNKTKWTTYIGPKDNPVTRYSDSVHRSGGFFGKVATNVDGREFDDNIKYSSHHYSYRNAPM